MSYRNRGSEPPGRPEVFERLGTVSSSDHNDYSYNSSYRNHGYNNSSSDYYRYRRRSPSLYYNDRYDDRYDDRYNDRYDDRYGDRYYNNRYSYRSSDSGLKIANSYNNNNNSYHHKQDYYSSSSDKSRINFVKNDKKPISFVPNKSSEDSYDRKGPSPTTDRDKVARDLQITVTRDKKLGHQDKQDDAYNTSSATSREIAMAPSQRSESNQRKSSSYKTDTKYIGNGAGTDNNTRSNSQADQQKSQVKRNQSPPNKSKLEKKSVDNNKNNSSVEVAIPTTPTRKPAPSFLPALREIKSDSTVHLEKPPTEPAAMRNGKIAGLLDPLPKASPVTTKNVNNLSADSESTKRDRTTTSKQTPTNPSSIRTTVNQKDRGNNPIKEKSDSQRKLSNAVNKPSLPTTNDPKLNTNGPSTKLTPSATAKTLNKQDIKTVQSSQLKVVADNRVVSPNSQEQQIPKQQQQPAPPATTVAHGQQEPIKHTEESTHMNDSVSMHAPSQASVEQQKKEMEKKLEERHAEQLQQLLRLQEGEEELAREHVNKETEADQNTITTLQELIKSSQEKQSKHEEQMSMFPPESQEWMEARNNIEVIKIFIKDLNDQHIKIMYSITSILNQRLEAIQIKFKELIRKAQEEYDSEKKQIDDSFKIKKSDSSSSTKKSATSIKNATEPSATAASPQAALLTNQYPTQDTMKQQTSEQITSNSIEKQNAIPSASPVKATHMLVETGPIIPTPQKQTSPEPTKQTIPTPTASPQTINTEASKMNTNDTEKQNNVNNSPNNPITRKRRRIFADSAEASVIINNDVLLTSPDTTTTTTTSAPSPKQQHIEKPVDEEQVARAVKRHKCDLFVPADHGIVTSPFSASASAQSLNEANLPKKDRRELLLPIDERDDVVIDIFTKKGAVHRQSPVSTNPFTLQTSPVEVPISDPMEVDQESIRDSNKAISAQEVHIEKMDIEQPVTETPEDKKPVTVDSSTTNVPAKKPRTTTKLPKIWKVRMDDDTGDVYYQHKVTGEIRLDRPC
ncbi:hypothetical protein G6F70_003639 [Rhizopus microsporus]|uniref:WW domain-containing protein n=2 Tax=Rhizopus TaxID=4842 RepID=A0A367JLB1_RHIAZ|nr:hypothetical protein G6F71_003642 [Rhizopus microsporus]KAG1200889.1 hypothetical protein G6F70_003639 [Rhizopus microsporus]KAG1212763.1 hypothetical protein G6F69_003407 [Rhizopus microsporus]ORE13786.1 hypothetical protein BCV71DRAFT_277372 [Rhizopus microsporus]RCH90740.1 hypothetical protein CU097_010766 [Rhizopus azygosporus]